MKHYCSYCDKVLPEEKFTVDKTARWRNFRAWRCRDCDKVQRKEARKKYPKRFEKRNKKLREFHKTKEGQLYRRNVMYKARYGINVDIYNDMLKQQDGKCAICGKKHVEENKKRLHVDHNHTTGAVRGLLCLKCNTGLQHVEKDGWVYSAMKYINKHLSEV